MNVIPSVSAAIPPLDEAAAAEARRRLDDKTKPAGSLGRLETLAVRLAAMRGEPSPLLSQKVIVVAAADHGVAAEGVSAYPAEVTAQMVRNFAAGGAAVCVLARVAGARIVVVDAGVRGGHDFGPGVISLGLADGTASLLRGPAMAVELAERAVEAGIALAMATAEQGADIIALGDMGIGNTTAASALVAAYTGAKPAAVAGRGTGIDDAGLARKRAALAEALALHLAEPRSPLEILARLGGLELAFLAGVTIGGAALRRPILLDGHPTTAAALAAAALAPRVRDYLIASHRSAEPAHTIALEHLGTEPLLDLGLRLGEGTGAALAMPLLEAACRVVRDMATFSGAGVSRG